MTKKDSAIAIDHLKSIAGNKLWLSAFLKKLDYSEIEKLAHIAEEVRKEKYVEYQHKLREEAELEAKKQALLEQAAALGIAIEVIEGAKPKKVKKSSGIDREKYAFKDAETGEIHYWSGIGHPTREFKVVLATGVKKDRLLNPKVEGHIYEFKGKKPKAQPKTTAKAKAAPKKRGRPSRK